MVSILFRFIFLFLFLFLATTCFTVFSQRIVPDPERGSYYIYPDSFNWKHYAAYGGQPVQTNTKGAGYHDEMREDALKVPHGRFQHFHPSDTHAISFPYPYFRAYNDRLIRLGDSSLFVNTTVNDTKHQVIFNYDPENAAEDKYVVHFRNRAYIHFFIHQYARDKMYEYNGQDSAQGPVWRNMAVGLDNYNFPFSTESCAYGHRTDDGNWNNCPAWDKPYPQNEAELLAAVDSFMREVHRLAPDVRLMANSFGNRDEASFRFTLDNIMGMFNEGFMSYFNSSIWGRLDVLWQYRANRYAAERGKIGITQLQLIDDCHLNPQTETQLLAGLMAYLICKGDNYYFGPGCNRSVFEEGGELPPKLYSHHVARLGHPIGSAQDSSMVNKDDPNDPYRLYWRAYQGGIVYLNYSGRTLNIPLPVEHEWFDQNGNSITTLTLADMTGGYATLTAENRCTRPNISPRLSGEIKGPITVQLWADNPDWTIYYTLDGSEPTPLSPIYSNGLTLMQPTTVRAKAFSPDLLESFETQATYDVVEYWPTVNFHLTNDSGLEMLQQYFVLASLSHVSVDTVRIQYQVTGGSATAGLDIQPTAGQLIFLPFEQYKYFRLKIIDDEQIEPNETVVCTLANPEMAVMGSKNRFVYTLIDDEGDGKPTSRSKSALLKPEINVYPNPSQDSWHVQLSTLLNTPINYSIYDINGSQVLNQPSTAYQFSIDNNAFSTGVYWLEVTLSDGQRLRSKLLK